MDCLSLCMGTPVFCRLAVIACNSRSFIGEVLHPSSFYPALQRLQKQLHFFFPLNRVGSQEGFVTGVGIDG